MRAMQLYAGSDVLSPAYAISKVFDYQSYFDSTLLQGAILTQRIGSQIVASTLADQDISGYAVGLHPSSQTPVAVQFKSGSNNDRSGVHILKPGQVIRPTGGSQSHAFKGFTWGLPYGWLGGGQATLLIFRSADADVLWPGAAEVIFHRARFAVKQPSDLTLAGAFNNAPNNWPMRFPWTNAAAGSASIPQYGTPSLSIAEPTRVAMQLRLAGGAVLAAPASVRMLFQATEDLGLDSASDPVLTFPCFYDITWDSWANVGTTGNLSSAIPVKIITSEPVVRLAADQGGVLFVDLTGAAVTFSEAFIDICRYGKL